MKLALPLVLATQNNDKAREIVEIFVAATDEPFVAYAIEEAVPTPHSQVIAFLVDTPADIADAVAKLPVLHETPDVEETGATLEANARIKGRALAAAFGLLTIADDTGLEVDALNGAPGVYSARYAGENASYDDNVTKLLDALANAADRTARFVTAAIAIAPDGSETLVRGEVEGSIATERRGDGGFGYDPVFIPSEGDGRAFAEMSAAEKHAISHRGRAFRALGAALTREV